METHIASASYNNSFLTKDNNITWMFIVSIMMFLINPLVGVIAAFVVLFGSSSISERRMRALFVMISFFLALLNTTRIPESDFLNYKIIFERAGSLSYSEFIAIYDRELLYFIANYILNPILLGNFKFYIIFVTMIQYLLRFGAIRIILRNSDHRIVMFAIFMSFLEPYSFFSSVHLLRQMLSASIFMYFFAKMHGDNKIYWWMIPLSAFIHSSSLILFVIAFIPKLNSEINLRLLSIITLFFVVMVFWGDSILMGLSRATSAIAWLNYPFARMQNIEASNYSWYEGTGNNTNLLRYLTLPAIFSIYLRKKDIDDNYAVNFILIYYGLLAFWIMTGLYYLQMRMTLYLYPFMGIALALMVAGLKDRMGKSVAIMAAFVIGLFFSYRFMRPFWGEEGFKMIRGNEILVRPLVQYIYELFF